MSDVTDNLIISANVLDSILSLLVRLSLRDNKLLNENEKNDQIYHFLAVGL